MTKKPGTLWMRVEIMLNVDEGLSLNIWEREMPLPKSIRLSDAELKAAARFTPAVRRMLIDSKLLLDQAI